MAAMTELVQDSGIAQVSGRIKWFDPDKGFGFIVPDDSGKDILLHVTTLLASGHNKSLDYSGAVVTVQAFESSKGRQCVKIESLTLEKSTPVERPFKGTRISGEEFGPELMEVKWFNRNKGYGFLERPRGSDVFVHMETLRACRLLSLTPGQRVQVVFGQREDQRQGSFAAVHLELVP